MAPERRHPINYAAGLHTPWNKTLRHVELGGRVSQVFAFDFIHTGRLDRVDKIIRIKLEECVKRVKCYLKKLPVLS